MGEPLDVSTDDLAKLAGHLRDSAGAVASRSTTIGSPDNLFGTGRNGGECEAGRAYVAQGTAIHDGIRHMAAWLRHWSDATAATADAFGRSAMSYGYTDGYNSEQISN